MAEVKIKKIAENIYEIPKQGKMNVPAIILASEKLLKDMKSDETFQQAMNTATLPGLIKNVVLCPDAHMGYGLPIGGVATFDMDSGIITPGGVGFDINCSVRLLKTNLNEKDIEKKKKEIIDKLYRDVPSGVGEKGRIKLTKEELREVLINGAQWAVKQGYGVESDWKHTEEEGKMQGAKPEYVSERAVARGVPQLGSLGAGNHFLEVQKVDKIYDKEIAKAFGIEKEGQVTIMIHCGSRGLGHQVASDYIKKMEDEYGFANLPDRELINAPINSKLGKEYYGAMACAANFAFANKQLITHWVRDTMTRIFPEFKADVVYDVCHNIAKFEKHNIDGKEKLVCVHRKGATRSFGPGREEIPIAYRNVGQPVLIPGTMGTASYVLVGTKKAEELTFGSTAHGAGRVMSRHGALHELRGEDVKKQLAEKNIEIKAGSWKSIAEEAPQVYKDVDEVVKVSHELGIGNLVARLVPLGVMKG